MTDSPAAVGLGFVAFALLVLAIRVVQVRLTPPARLEHVPSTGARDGSGDCPGHWYRLAFADMWRCVNCGHLQPVSAQDVLDAAAEDFRDELGHVEAYANGEVGA